MHFIQLLKYFLFSVAICYLEFSFAKSNPDFKHHVKGISRPIIVTIAASTKDDEKLERRISFFNIHCFSDSCGVEQISLNECTKNKNGELSFTPTVEEWVSWAGSLEANLKANVLDITIFQRTHRVAVAKIVLELDFSNIKHVKAKSFKATGFESDGNEELIEYTPIMNDQIKQINCPVFLPGINP